MPDYFGFIIGFLLIWLVYTGFNAVRGVFVSTQNKVVHYSEQAKKITTESVNEIKKHISTNEAVDAIEKKLARARIKEPKKVVTSNTVSKNVKKSDDTKSWTTKQLKRANSFINGLILGIEDFIYEPEEHHHVDVKLVEPKIRKRSDSLEWFQ